jgi:hypothetical protein
VLDDGFLVGVHNREPTIDLRLVLRENKQTMLMNRRVLNGALAMHRPSQKIKKLSRVFFFFSAMVDLVDGLWSPL